LQCHVLSTRGVALTANFCSSSSLGTHYETKPAESKAPPSISSASHLFTFFYPVERESKVCFSLLFIAAEKLRSYDERTVSLASSLTHLINLFPSWVSFEEEEEEEDPTMALVHITRSVVVRRLLRGRSPSQQPQWCRLFSGNNQEAFVLFRLHCEFCHEDSEFFLHEKIYCRQTDRQTDRHMHIGT
jgi:hypothetical protein